MEVQSITNCLGKTLTVGQHVTHHDGWTGVIYKITDEPNMRAALVYVTPDDISQVPRYDCWPLNEEQQKLHSKTEFCRARDHGLSMGNWKEACE